MDDEYSQGCSSDYGVIFKNGLQLSLDEIISEIEKRQLKIKQLESKLNLIEYNILNVYYEFNGFYRDDILRIIREDI